MDDKMYVICEVDADTSMESERSRSLSSLPAEPGIVLSRRVPVPPTLPEWRLRSNSVQDNNNDVKCDENAEIEDSSGRDDDDLEPDYDTPRPSAPVLRSQSVPSACRPAKWPPACMIQITDEDLSQVKLKKTGRTDILPENDNVAAIIDRPLSTQEKDLTEQPWFFGLTNRTESEKKLSQFGKDGTFLVRPCQHAGPNEPYALSILYRAVVYHVTIRQTPSGKYALGSEKQRETVFNSVSELVSFHHNNAILLKSSKQATCEEALLTGCPR